MATKKRCATRELNHDNWNDDEEKEEPGVFEQAGSDVLQARVIKKAKRRGVTASSAEPGSGGTFAGFSGFKSASVTSTESKPSFDFLKGEVTSASSGSSSSSSTTSSTNGNTKSSSLFGSLKKESSSSASPSPIPLSEMFKPKPGSWKCSVCDVSNESSADKCVACTTAKPGAPSKAATVSSKWTCDTCMVPNAADANECVCCQTKKPGSTSTKSTTFGSASSGSGFSFGSASKSGETSTFKFGVPSSTAKSENNGSGFKFETKASPTSSSGFKFGSSSTPTNSAPSTGFTFGSASSKVESSSPSTGFKFGTSSNTKSSNVESSSTGFKFQSSQNSSTNTTVSMAASPLGFKFTSTTSSSDGSNKSPAVSSGFSFKSSPKESPVSTPTTTGFKFETSSSSSTPSSTEVKFGSFSSDAEKKDVSKEESNASKSNSKGKFTANLRALNRQVAKWIMSKVEENPNVILSPIFDDYEKHLKDVTDKYAPTTSAAASPAQSKKDSNPLLGAVFGNKDKSENKVSFSTGSSGNSGFGNFTKTSAEVLTTKTTDVATSDNDKSKKDEKEKDEPPKSEPFSSTATSNLFSFGSAAATKSTFSFGNTASNTSSGFSFGKTSTPVFSGTGSSSFFTGTTAATPANTKKEESDNGNVPEDEPPKVEVKTVEESDAKFSMRSKLYYKKEKDFVDRGLGTLHLKVLEDKKVQLLVRAETNLGNILLNILINEKITFNQRGNNLQFVTIPNPIIKGMPEGPVTMLVKVKTEAMAKELHAKIQEILKETS